MMKLSDAKIIAEELLKPENLGQHISKHLICGSIRRERESVNDIDFVIIPKPENKYQFGEESFNDTIKKLDENGANQINAITLILGPKIKRFSYKGISIDIYIANEKTFETLVLIRTGSTEHNVKMTKLARGKNLKLFADGSGLCKIKGGIYNNEQEKIVEIIESTEKGILMNLLDRYVEPKDRF